MAEWNHNGFYRFLEAYEAYRPITLCSKIGELLEELIYNKISMKCDHGDNQFGFQDGFGVQNAHATLLANLKSHKMQKVTSTFVHLLFQRLLTPFFTPKQFYISLEVKLAHLFAPACGSGIRTPQYGYICKVQLVIVFVCAVVLSKVLLLVRQYLTLLE